MKMPKHAGMMIHILLFFVIFLLLFQNVSRVLVFGEKGLKMRIRGFYEEPANSIDVVFLGPSSIYPYFIPGLAYQEYGLVSYNFGIPAMKISMIKYSLMEVDKLQNPDLFVIDIRTAVSENTELNEVRKRRLIDNMELGEAKLEVIHDLVDTEDRISYYLGIIKYHTRWKEISKTDLQVLLRKTDPKKGFQARLKIKPCEEYVWTGTTQEREALTEENEKSLRELLAYCKENNINALFTASPWCMTEQTVKRQNSLKDIVAEYGFTMLDANDYYEEMDWDFNTDMDDKKHANVLGAAKYTTFLSDYLMKHYDLEDKSNDAKYEEWNQAYNLYLKNCAKIKKKYKNFKLE